MARLNGQVARRPIVSRFAVLLWARLGARRRCSCVRSSTCAWHHLLAMLTSTNLPELLQC